MALLNSTWVEAGLAMRVGPVDGQGFALVWAKNNTQNLLVLSPSPQALLNACGVQPPEVRQQPAEPTVAPAAAFTLPRSLADIQDILHKLPSNNGWLQAGEETLTTLDKAVVECLAALGFSDSGNLDAAA
jgi:hypothetical protein